MSTRTVKTQAELDQALADRVDYIDIESLGGVLLYLSSSGSATVRASGSATVRASGSATVRAYGSATVHASGSATVHAYGSATVHASDSATVHAYDSATVTAGKYVAVHLHNKRAKVQGGVLIDVTDIDTSDPAEWCEIQGVDVEDGYAIVYKTVNDQLVSGRGTEYPIGKKVTAPDWQQTDACGRGLHFGPTPGHDLAYYLCDSKPRFLACRIKLADAIGLTGDGTAKIKAKSCKVLHEVDLAGRPL